jgi:hypothetical protein
MGAAALSISQRMSIEPNSRTAHLISRGLGALLALLGLLFLALGVVLIFLRDAQELTYLQGGLFAIVLGATLVWAGWRLYVRVPNGQGYPDARSALHVLLLGCRGVVEVLGTAGCALMLAHALALSMGSKWPPDFLFWALIRAPVVFGLITFALMAPDVLEEGVFPHGRWSRWSPITRQLLLIIVRVGWLGYIPVLWVIFHVPGIQSPTWERGAQITASIAVSVLYASQVVILRFGRLKESPFGFRAPYRL